MKDKFRSKMMAGLILLLALSLPWILQKTPLRNTLSNFALTPLLRCRAVIKKYSPLSRKKNTAPSSSRVIQQLREELYQCKLKLRQVSRLAPHILPSSKMVLSPLLLNSSCTPHQRRIFIGGGKKDGFRKGQAVLFANQVVGKISRVLGKVSQVQLLSDGGFKMSVRSQRTRKTFVLETESSGEITLKHIQFDQDLRPGDTLVSTGWEGNFPPGALVGKVGKIEGKNYRLFLRVQVEWPVEPRELEQVVVILPGLPEKVGK